ncbi:MAG: hypothetical protein IKH56_00610 [Oscillospiraceae bacterium]|nr:hypothetical protein [Oscillospiraceae bacterium]
MKEITEIRVGDAEIVFGDNIVKSSILPQSSKDLSRNVKIQSNVVIEGGVYANNIEITGGEVEFKGAVFANNELYISSDVSGLVHFHKAVASSGSVGGFLTAGRAIFGSDINAKQVRLKNCFVGGSIFAQDVYLENCVVLGGVFAGNQLTVTNAIVGTFNAPEAELAGISYLLYPTCFSVEPLTYLPGTELYNLSLANLGALYKGEPEMEYTGKIRMDLESDRQRTTLVDDDGVTTSVYSYSVSGRVLAADIIDLEKLENHFLIGSGALDTQILKVYSLSKADGSKSEPLTVPNVSGFFFNILSGKVTVQDLNGEISFSEIRKVLE